MPANIDPATVIGIVVLIFQAYNQFNTQRMRAEILELKVLLYRDFVSKEDHHNSGYSSKPKG